MIMCRIRGVGKAPAICGWCMAARTACNISQGRSVAGRQTHENVTEGECAFCAIQGDKTSCFLVYEDEDVFVFLDHWPLFPGHCLLITKAHVATLAELPLPLLHGISENMRLIAIAVQRAMRAEGTFLAINNIVSQSVPHFHVHIVPRRKGDDLRGFFWPRTKYKAMKKPWLLFLMNNA